jgi:hypothetical protein
MKQNKKCDFIFMLHIIKTKNGRDGEVIIIFYVLIQLKLFIKEFSPQHLKMLTCSFTVLQNI